VNEFSDSCIDRFLSSMRVFLLSCDFQSTVDPYGHSLLESFIDYLEIRLFPMEFAIQSVDIGDIRHISNYIFHYSL
jgi:hypothetical protein